MYFGLPPEIIDIIREIDRYEGLKKIAHSAARDAAIGHRKEETNHARQIKIQNKLNEQRLQVYNKKMTLWRCRHRTCK